VAEDGQHRSDWYAVALAPPFRKRSGFPTVRKMDKEEAQAILAAEIAALREGLCARR
jgi:hypothetical protein